LFSCSFSPLSGELTPSRKGNIGFTLTELLVVMAVILIIAALLFPAIGQASHNARAAKCVSNLRQLGVGVAHYHADNNTFPTGGWTSGITWVDQIFPYVGQSKDIFYCPEGGTKGPGGMAGWNNFPAPWQSYTYSMHYAYNACLNPEPLGGVAAGPRNMQSSHSLSKLPVIVDIVWENNFYNFSGCFPKTPTPTIYTSFACRHNGMGNVLWGDGSVTANTTQSLYALTVQYGVTAFCLGNY
jgi:prepilin-type N-terminal cleavage/methylation domain-containing protein/prepilin-type processing-associated H-X9-DG protein